MDKGAMINTGGIAKDPWVELLDIIRERWVTLNGLVERQNTLKEMDPADLDSGDARLALDCLRRRTRAFVGKVTQELNTAEYTYESLHELDEDSVHTTILKLRDGVKLA